MLISSVILKGPASFQWADLLCADTERDSNRSEGEVLWCAVAGRASLLMLDLSGGKESRRIPVFNQVDADQPPTDLEYIR